MSWLPKVERRKYLRIPCHIDIKIKRSQYNTTQNAKSVDISKEGIQILLGESVRLYEHIQIIPESDVINNPKNVHTYKAEVRWIKPYSFSSKDTKTKYLAGLKFIDNIDWNIPISNIEQNLDQLNSQLYLRILSLIDERLILINPALEAIWINKRSDWDFLNITDSSNPIDTIFNLKTHSQRLKDIILNMIIHKKFTTTLIPSFNLIAFNNDKIVKPFDILILPLLSNRDELKYILMRIKLNGHFNHIENMRWIDYRYLYIGRLIEEMVEEIINPVAATMGRLELLSLKIDNIDKKVNNKNNNIHNDLESIKSNIKTISNICRSILKDRNTDLIDNLNIFSLSDLIKEEVSNIKLHKTFSNINIKLSLEQNLIRIYGNYELWALAIKTLLKNLQKKMKHTQDKKILIETFNKDNKILIRITHTGKQLKKNILEEPDLSIFHILSQEYPLNIYIDGPSGNQSIEIGISLIVKSEQMISTYSKKLFIT